MFLGGRKPKMPESCKYLDLVDVERVLVKHHINVAAAAKELGVSSTDLRRMTWSVPRLIEAALEENERLVDEAQDRLQQALYGDNLQRSLAAATFILSHHRAARARGWGPGGHAAYEDPPQRVEVCWVGDAPGYRPPLSTTSPSSAEPADELMVSSSPDSGCR